MTPISVHDQDMLNLATPEQLRAFVEHVLQTVNDTDDPVGPMKTIADLAAHILGCIGRRGWDANTPR